MEPIGNKSMRAARKRFTADQIAHARRVYELQQRLKAEGSLRALAGAWGVDINTVWKMARGETYKSHIVGKLAK